jgi:hypothetical protein
MESSEEHTLTLEFSFRYHPGRHAGFQLIHIDRRLDAGGKLREGQGKSVRVVFLAETCLHVNANAPKLVHEMSFLGDDIPKLIPHLAQTFLQRVDSFLEIQIFVQESGSDVRDGHLETSPLAVSSWFDICSSQFRSMRARRCLHGCPLPCLT